VANRAKPLTRHARTYISTVAAVGLPVAAYCVYTLLRRGVPSEFFVFAVLTLVSGRFTLKIPSVDAYCSPSEMFTFTNVLLFGPEAGAVTLAADSLLLAWQRKLTVAQTLFNLANLALSVWLAGTIFFRIAGIEPMFATEMVLSSRLILPLTVFAATYYVVNSGLTATAIAFARERSVSAVWRDHFLWLGPGCAAGVCVALLLVVALHQVHFSVFVLGLIPPLLLLFYVTMRSSFGRVEDAKEHVASLNRLYLSTVETLATAIDAKDEVTHGHIRRVQIGAVALAREIGITDDATIQAIEAAALLHDTGKIAVPEHILNKPGKLTPAEFEKMKLHAPIGAEILSVIDFPYPVVPIVRHHHENWDGTGYPDRIGGETIPIGARILSVVDCFDALTSDRPYRRRMSNTDAIAILIERRGTMYDPAVVDTFVRHHERIMPAPESEQHPVSRALGEARAAQQEPEPVASGQPDTLINNEVLAVASLARAVSGEAEIADVGALTWMMLRPVLPCVSMALFVYDEKLDALTAEYVAGLHAGLIRGRRQTLGSGVAGWAAATRRFVLNADPASDVGTDAASAASPLRSSLTMPLVHSGELVGVISLYASTADAFSDDHARLLTLLAPSLATSIAALPKHGAWMPASEPKRTSVVSAFRRR